MEYMEKYRGGKYLTQDGSKAELIRKHKNSSKKIPRKKAECILVKSILRYSGSCALQRVWP